MCAYVYIQEDENSAPQTFVAKKKLDLAVDALRNLRNCNTSFNSPTDLNNYVDGVLASIKEVK